MAMAATIQPSPVRTEPIRIAPSPVTISRKASNEYQPKKISSVETPGSRRTSIAGGNLQCDACRKRQIRCAINEKSGKCYSCDFHRQDCMYSLPSPVISRKRVNEDELEGRRSRKGSFPRTHQPPPPQTLSFSLSTNADSTRSTKEYQRSTDSFCFTGMTTDLEITLLANVPHDSKGETSIGNMRLRNMQAQQVYMTVTDPNSSSQEIREDLLQELEGFVRMNWQSLTGHYNDVLRPAIPITTESNLSPFPREAGFNTSDTLLQAAICSFTSRLSEGKHSQHGTSAEQLHRLRSMGIEALRANLSQPTLSTIQTGLLFCQDPEIICPSLTAQLVVAGNMLGLNQDCSDWMIDDHEKRLRKRLSWTLYVQDKWNALVYGCPSSIQPANWTVKRLCLEDFELQQSSPEDLDSSKRLSHGASLLMQMIDLTGILSDILETFFTIQANEELKAAGSSECTTILARAKPIQIKLKHWFSSLPAFLKMDMPVDEEFLSNGPLHLAYFATEITLHRCIIRSIKPDTDKYLAYICRAAAKTRLISAMDFVNRLRPAHLNAFWPFSARINFALIGAFGTLLRITAPTFEEAEFYRMRLEEYRWTLTVSRKTHDFFDYAIQSLDAACEAALNVPEKPAFEILRRTNHSTDADSPQDMEMAEAAP